MKVFLLLLVAVTAVLAREVPTQQLTAFGYLVNHGIPEADRIRKAEEQYLNSPESRIVGGSPAAANQFPYQAGLIIDMVGINGTSACGGSLISTDRVLTAAHCWFDGEHQAWQFTVVLGSITLYTGGTRVQTSQVVLHPEWNPFLIRNDVAVIYLPSSVALSASIAPIALPSGDELSNSFAGHTAVASGFGLTSDNGGIAINQFLSHVNLNVITNNLCNLFYFTPIQETNICTSGFRRKGTCYGDSGGPLVVNSNNRNILVGVTSFVSTLGCAVGFPAAYARVTTFINFINENM